MNNIKKDVITFSVLQWAKDGREFDGEVFRGTLSYCDAFVAANKKISELQQDRFSDIFEIVLSKDEE